MNKRKRDEIEFHDRLRHSVKLYQRWSQEAEKQLAGDPHWSNFKYYSIERKSVDYMRRLLLSRCEGNAILDYGCGNGEEALFAAEHGAREVVGIDISQVAVKNSLMRAKENGLDGAVHFLCADGEALPFPDSHFDVAMEYGVLHHVDLHAAMRELVRVLKPDGEMVCTESLAHNPVIRLYRRLTPHLRTAWEVEHVLRKENFKIIAQYFDGIEIKFFHLFALCAVPLRKLPIFPAVLWAMETVDDFLLRLPFIKWQAWQAMFILSKPKKSVLKG